MRLQAGLRALGIDEATDLAVGIARDVRERRGLVGPLAQPVDGEDGELLLDAPHIGQALEQREVANQFLRPESVCLLVLFGVGFVFVLEDVAHLS